VFPTEKLHESRGRRFAEKALPEKKEGHLKKDLRQKNEKREGGGESVTCRLNGKKDGVGKSFCKWRE